MITREALLAAGYRPFKQKNIREFTDQFYQKHFDDFSYSPVSQFTTGRVVFDAVMHSPESVEQMEAFFERMWVDMKCDYYELF